MVWVRLDDSFPDHRKIAELGDYAPLCGWLFICGLAYCNRQLTDGLIPKGHVVRLSSFRRLSIETGGVPGMMSMGDDIDADTLALLLESVGLWEDRETHWYIHDYPDYQPTKAEVEAERANKQAAGRAGGQARAERRGQAGAQAKSNPGPVPVPVPVIPIQEPIAAAAREREFSFEDAEFLNETDEAVARLIREWERATGTTVTAMLGDELVSSLGQLPEEWIADAIKETGRSGARSWKYTNAILDRWKLEGREQSPVVDATEKFRNSRVLEAANKWKAATQ
jgi:hypothetical protein